MNTPQGVVAPYPLAMVICDWIWRDPYNGKATLLGTFSAIFGVDFPLIHPILSVYVSLTDGRGIVPLRLELIDADEQREAIFSLTQDIEFPDPRMIAEIGFVAANIQFPEPGEYRLQLFAANEFVIERRILVSMAPTQPSIPEQP
jgi:hypothetical protein